MYPITSLRYKMLKRLQFNQISLNTHVNIIQQQELIKKKDKDIKILKKCRYIYDKEKDTAMQILWQ